METIQFENEYILTKNLAKEVANKIFKKTRIIGFILAIFNFVGYFKLKYVYYLLIGIGCIFTSILTPIMNANRLMEKYKCNNGKIEKTKIQFGENIKLDRGKNHLEFEYNNICSKYESENSIILRTKTSKKANMFLVIIIEKNSFVKRKFGGF